MFCISQTVKPIECSVNSGTSSRIASPRPLHSSPKATSPPSSPKNLPTASPPPPPLQSPIVNVPKKRRGRPPRKVARARVYSASKILPKPQQPQVSTNATPSILLEAFPLPPLDKVNDDNIETSEEKTSTAALKQTPSCKKEGFFLTPQKPPDSPPSGENLSRLIGYEV